MKIKTERIGRDLEALSRFGAAKSGIFRFAYTPEERQALSFLQSLMEEAGMMVQVDPIGNLVGTYRGGEENLPAVIMGSHIDTVPGGGKYDGAAGIIGGIEVVRTMVDEGYRPRHPVEVIVFVNEEGYRFPGPMLGSHALVYGITAQDLENRDGDGISLTEALKGVGIDPQKAYMAKRNPLGIKAYLELHIEQGSILESQGLSVGIVTGIAGLLSAKAEITGKADHAGSTPMPGRKDALAGAAEVILAVERIAKESLGGNTVATVGSLQVQPGAANVIPGKVLVSFDIRDIDLDMRTRAVEGIKVALDEICRHRQLQGVFQVIEDNKPCKIPKSMVERLKAGCQRAGIPAFEIISGAAHDAMNVHSIAETGMIFIRSKDGISHSPLEYSALEDIGAGVEVLYEAVKELSG